VLICTIFIIYNIESLSPVLVTMAAYNLIITIFFQYTLQTIAASFGDVDKEKLFFKRYHDLWFLLVSLYFGNTSYFLLARLANMVGLSFTLLLT